MLYKYKIIIVILLLSNSFIEEKCTRIILKKSRKMMQKLSIRIPIIVVVSILIKNMIS